VNTTDSRHPGRDEGGRFAPGNQAARTHGAHLARREGARALSEEHGRLFQTFVDRAIADLGGIHSLSMIEIALVEAAATQYAIIGAFNAYLSDVSPMTPTGRVRTAVRGYHEAVDRLDRLSQRLGLQRREGWQQAHRDLDAETADDVEDDDPEDDDPEDDE
jgi:hypothetical protein